MILTGLALGAVLGWVMQRGRFCVTGMIRDIFLNKTWRGFTALLIVIAVHAVGLAALTTAGVITPDYKQFAPLAVVLGGLLFGMGIVLAGGCASGTWYRSAEGLIGSWLALVFYAGSAAAMKGGSLAALNEGLRSWKLPITTVHASLGISVWWLVIPFALGVAFLARRFLVQEAQAPKMATLKPKKTGLAHLLAEKPWHFYPTAAIVGALGVLAWPLSAATGRNDGLGITSPSSNLSKFLISGEDTVDWGVMLVLGLLVGAFFAAKASGEFRLRVPSAEQAVRSVIGGVLMGVGASAAGGCTVGNGMVQTSCSATRAGSRCCSSRLESELPPSYGSSPPTRCRGRCPARPSHRLRLSPRRATRRLRRNRRESQSRRPWRLSWDSKPPEPCCWIERLRLRTMQLRATRRRRAASSWLAIAPTSSTRSVRCARSRWSTQRQPWPTWKSAIS